MARLDHLALKASDLEAVRDWYVFVLDLEVEFDTPDAVGLKDEADFTLILSPTQGLPTSCSLYFRVPDVDRAHAEMAARGVTFVHAPQDNFWGYGAGLLDPDGRFVGLWDETSMASRTPPDG